MAILWKSMVLEPPKEDAVCICSVIGDILMASYDSIHNAWFSYNTLPNNAEGEAKEIHRFHFSTGHYHFRGNQVKGSYITLDEFKELMQSEFDRAYRGEEASNVPRDD